MRFGAGVVSTLSMMIAAILAGSPGRRLGAVFENSADGAGRRAVVGRHRRAELSTAVPEAGAGTARLDDRDADIEGGQLGHQCLGEALDAPLARVIQRRAREGGLPTECRDLDDAGLLLRAKVRQRAAHDLDRAQQIGADLVDDLVVGEFLSGTEQSVARIVDDDVDRAEGARMLRRRPSGSRPCR